MSPTIVVKDGKTWLVTGSPGGSRIITTVLQMVVNSIDFGMNVAEATNAPRFHHQWLPDELRVEKGFSPDTSSCWSRKGRKWRERGDGQYPEHYGWPGRHAVWRI
jgi:gamma-glutamyltranspeptidase/glutathione hydrolase